MSEKRTSFEDFLLTEYNNIAQAHFKTKENISSFFKYYILLISIPFSAVAIVIKNNDKFPSGFEEKLPILIISLFILITIVGIIVMFYVIRLDQNSKIYARTVNGIRWYFYQNSNISSTEIEKICVLPLDNTIPKYEGSISIKLLSLCFAIANTFYSTVALYLANFDTVWVITTAAGVLLLHYLLIILYRKYFRSLKTIIF